MQTETHDQSASAETDVSAPAQAEAPIITKLYSPLELQKNLRGYDEEQRELLIWFNNHADSLNWSRSQMAEIVGVSASLISQLYAGKYRGNGGVLTPPPAKMLSYIRRLRDEVRLETQRANAGRIKTPTVEQIWQVCDRAWQQHEIGMIFGDPQTQKSESLQWYRDEHNHGSTIYVDLNGCTGVQDIWRAFGRALKLGYTSPTRLRERILQCIEPRNLVLVDEFHQATFSYRKNSSSGMVHAVKAVYDLTKCGMVICATNIARSDMERGADSPLCKQILRRGSILLQLPAALPVADCAIVCKAYKLTWESGARLWKNWTPESAGQEVVEKIAHDHGMRRLISVLRDASMLAKTDSRPISWGDVRKVYDLYEAAAAPKIA